jgi:hypothetical protein
MSGVKHTPEQVAAVLARVGERPGPIATHWMSAAAGCPGDTVRTRRLLKRLERQGLVEGVQGISSGTVRWWKITDAGRAAITKATGAPT